MLHRRPLEGGAEAKPSRAQGEAATRSRQYRVGNTPPSPRTGEGNTISQSFL